MAAELKPEHPFAAVDLKGMDQGFPALLARAAGADRSGREGRSTAGNLSARERRLFRFGLLAGLGEWALAAEAMASLLAEGLLTGPEVERAAAEAALVKGWPACVHLKPGLEDLGLLGPADVAGALAAIEASNRANPEGGLSEREVFSLGLGLTWGARCWDT